jgi:hypothetical protein
MFCAGESAAGELFEDNSSFRALEAAWKAWKESAEFKGDFVLREGHAPTKELALQGNFGSKIGEPKAENRAVGTFAKLGGRIRYSQQPKRDLKEEGPIAQQHNENEHSFDEISTDSLTLLSQTQGGRLAALVTPRPDNLAGKAVSGIQMSLTFHPFSAGLRLDGTLTEFLAARPGFDEKVVSSSIDKPDASHIEIHVVKTFGKDTDTIDVRCRFRTDVSPPVMERIDMVNDFPSLNSKQECVVIFEDFVQCEGGLMPRCVRKAFGPIVPRGKEKPVWLASEWKSTDLGKVRPTEEDFVYVAPATSSIVGLNAKVPVVDGKFRLDLGAYTSKDFDIMPDGSIVATEQNSALGREADATAGGSRYVAVIVCGVLIAVLVVFILVWQRGRRR